MKPRFTAPVIIIVLGLTLVSGLIAWRLIAPPSSTTRQYLVLDEAGCRAAKHFGLAVTPLETAQACELEAEAELEFNWVTIEANRINRNHVIGTHFRTEKVRP